MTEVEHISTETAPVRRKFSVLSADSSASSSLTHERQAEMTVQDSEDDVQSTHENQAVEEKSTENLEPQMSLGDGEPNGNDHATVPPQLTIDTPVTEFNNTPPKKAGFFNGINSSDLGSPLHSAQSPLSPSSKALDQDGNIKVCIRLRPFNNREISHKSKMVVKFLDDHTVELRHPEKKDKSWKFAYDRLYYSFDNSKRRLATQEYIFKDMGKKLVQHALDGYNATLIAYGQTGSGKTHTIIGPHLSQSEPSDELLRKEGLVPRICREVFKRVQSLDAKREVFHNNSTSDLSLATGVASNGTNNRRRSTTSQNSTHIYFRMLEIYQEKVKDLLNPHIKNIKVSIQNEGEKKSIYISAPMQIVHSFEDIATLINRGNREKQVAETQMNERSSRSHTIFQIKIEQPAPGNKKRVSILNLVDLAGSENSKLAGTSGETLKEGAAINKSLSALGQVIDELVANQNKKKKKRSKKASSAADGSFVSYRNSILTTILANSIGGNSKTFMLCTISPADYNFSATKSTLRYGQKTKKIKNKAVVNEDSNVKLIRELKSNIETLKKQIQNGGYSGTEIRDLQQQLEESKLIQQQLATTIEEQEKSNVELEELRQKLMNEEEEKHRQKILIEQLRAEKLVKKRNANTQTILDLDRIQEIEEIENVEISCGKEEVHSDNESSQDEHSGEVDATDDHDSASDTSSSMRTDSSFDDFEIASQQELELSSPRLMNEARRAGLSMDSLDECAFQVPMDIDNMDHENPSEDETGLSDSTPRPASNGSPRTDDDDSEVSPLQIDNTVAEIAEKPTENNQEQFQIVSMGEEPDQVDVHSIQIEVPNEQAAFGEVQTIDMRSLAVDVPQQDVSIETSSQESLVPPPHQDVAISPIAALKKEMFTQMTPRASVVVPPAADDSEFGVRLMIQNIFDRMESNCYIDALEEQLETQHQKLLDEQTKYHKLHAAYNTLKDSHETVKQNHHKTESSVADLRQKFDLTQKELDEIRLAKESLENKRKKSKKAKCVIM
uniref:Kinesin motor domain-containing protein n=1 Tax=Percolomonas cosmopolitus TaxID=63605 RepID=A0A7S1KUC4_9EUKA|mmetsp:Transcript_9396/g.34859  ORF Transcript_9396/g.34859 Transcript_9396/m.34859 type:complete len:1011 (+) Transcript_9396:196-3228(+)|eukprot:CAMPEP_0117450832 /NCGR_PEP_ID=MMETSP0759-20121206/8678_1 /TAXON_ID=63605 /ORGANISM="Percolomonas cosmopolitus, Strain WS" /LENGTH=1010 /DNA_ID=CAMNT_0005243379 /DNA_START=173 /DNA_END=3205 /DNA_ORIENTATION=+